MIDETRGSIDYGETGEGPTVVLVPGSFSTGAAWRPVISQWDGRLRCVTTSLLGYGKTAERRTSLDFDISREAEIVEAVVRRAARPVHLVGHSFGGLVVLAAALRNRLPLLSITVIEAPFAEILPGMGERRLYGEFREISDAYLGAVEAGDRGAVERVIDFYGGARTFASWPQRARDYAVETVPVSILDTATIYGFRPALDQLLAIDVPTLVLCGQVGHPAVRRANILLGQCIRGARALTLAGAGHFMIGTHAEEMARAIAEHVVEHAASAQSPDRMIAA